MRTQDICKPLKWEIIHNGQGNEDRLEYKASVGNVTLYVIKESLRYRSDDFHVFNLFCYIPRRINLPLWGRSLGEVKEIAERQYTAFLDAIIKENGALPYGDSIR
jgi:hypothetical protein